MAIETGFRLDLLVEDRVIVEVKAVERLIEVHRAHLLSYLQLGGFVSVLAQFQRAKLTDGIVRFANGL